MDDYVLPCDNCPHEMECKADDECKLTDEQLSYYSNIIVDCTQCANSIKIQIVTHRDNSISPNPIRATTTGCSLKPGHCRFRLKTIDGSN